MRKTALLLLACFLLAGCMTVPSKRYFQIALSLDLEDLIHPLIGKVLYIEPVRTDPLYDDFRILYRVSPYELKYYSYDFWAKKPDTLLREAMGSYLDKRRGFSRVVLDVLQADPEITLRSYVRLVEEVDTRQAWFGRLAMDLEFLEFKSGRSLAKHSFDRRQPLEAKKVRFLPSTISSILKEELDKAVTVLAEALQEKGVRPWPEAADLPR
jgi:ABC-type uncharacterized transport system auxiliary subunit